MKSEIEKKISYFSAYPLKALNLPEEEYQSELRVRKPDSAKSSVRIRVLPMSNPYRESDFNQAIQNNSSNQ